jgi:hypothetical protein
MEALKLAFFIRLFHLLQLSPAAYGRDSETVRQFNVRGFHGAFKENTQINPCSANKISIFF